MLWLADLQNRGPSWLWIAPTRMMVDSLDVHRYSDTEADLPRLARTEAYKGPRSPVHGHAAAPWRAADDAAPSVRSRCEVRW